MYATVSVAAGAVAVWLLVVFVRAWPHRELVVREGRRSWIAGLLLLSLGAVFFVVAEIDPPGADLGEDLEFGAVVDGLGGDVSATGYALASMLLAFLLLGTIDPARSGRLLVRTTIAAVPFVATLTVLTALFDRSEWHDSSIGPVVGCLFFLTLPACAAGALLVRAASMPRVSSTSGSTLSRR